MGGRCDGGGHNEARLGREEDDGIEVSKLICGRPGIDHGDTSNMLYEIDGGNEE